jgi:hypothetical protein
VDSPSSSASLQEIIKIDSSFWSFLQTVEALLHIISTLFAFLVFPVLKSLSFVVSEHHANVISSQPPKLHQAKNRLHKLSELAEKLNFASRNFLIVKSAIFCGIFCTFISTMTTLRTWESNYKKRARKESYKKVSFAFSLFTDVRAKVKHRDNVLPKEWRVSIKPWNSFLRSVSKEFCCGNAQYVSVALSLAQNITIKVWPTLPWCLCFLLLSPKKFQHLKNPVDMCLSGHLWK